MAAMPPPSPAGTSQEGMGIGIAGGIAGGIYPASWEEELWHLALILQCQFGMFDGLNVGFTDFNLSLVCPLNSHQKVTVLPYQPYFTRWPNIIWMETMNDSYHVHQ